MSLNTQGPIFPLLPEAAPDSLAAMSSLLDPAPCTPALHTLLVSPSVTRMSLLVPPPPNTILPCLPSNLETQLGVFLKWSSLP